MIDTGRGKFSAHLDLREATARERLTDLLGSADIFVQGYRPGAIAHGLRPSRCGADLRPGIVCVSLCAYGYDGPWAAVAASTCWCRTPTGFNVAEAEALAPDKPQAAANQALDHATGYLMAFAPWRRSSAAPNRAAVARALSLAQTGHWFRRLGRVDGGLALPDPGLTTCATAWRTTLRLRRLTAVRHAAVMAETPTRWERPSVPLGTHPPAWPA